MSQGRDVWHLVACLPSDGHDILWGGDKCVPAVAHYDGDVGAFGVAYDITLRHIRSCLLLLMRKAKIFTIYLFN